MGWIWNQTLLPTLSFSASGTRLVSLGFGNGDPVFILNSGGTFVSSTTCIGTDSAGCYQENTIIRQSLTLTIYSNLISEPGWKCKQTAAAVVILLLPLAKTMFVALMLTALSSVSSFVTVKSFREPLRKQAYFNRF